MMSKLMKGSLCLATLAMLWFATPEAQAQRRSTRSGGGSWGGRSSGTSIYVSPGGIGYSRGYGGYGWDGYAYARLAGA